MHWYLQSNYVEAATAALAWALQRTGRRIYDFSLMPGQSLPNPPGSPDEPHFFYGSTEMAKRVRKDAQWARGMADTAGCFDQRLWASKRGRDMLNQEVELTTFGALRSRRGAGSYFVRPVQDLKAFPGQVVVDNDLEPLARSRGTQGLKRHPDDLLVAVSPALEGIRAEYRTVVLNHQVRLASRYRAEGTVSPQAGMPPAVLEAAQNLARGWMPADLVVMDVAEVKGGQARIVEFNSVHTSGLYAIDAEAFAQLVEAWCSTSGRFSQRDRPG